MTEQKFDPNLGFCVLAVIYFQITLQILEENQLGASETGKCKSSANIKNYILNSFFLK